MSNKKIIETLQERLNFLLEEKEQACERWLRDCPACSYEGLCGSEICEVEEMLYKAKLCLLDKPIPCSNCKWFWLCEYSEAYKSFRKKRKTELRRKCIEYYHGDCLECPKFPCEISTKTSLDFCKSEPYACRNCNHMPNCIFNKAKHYRKIMGIPEGFFIKLDKEMGYLDENSNPTWFKFEE